MGAARNAKNPAVIITLSHFLTPLDASTDPSVVKRKGKETALNYARKNKNPR